MENQTMELKDNLKEIFNDENIINSAEEVIETKNEAAEPTLEDKYELLQNDYTALNDKYLRAAAEFDNFRRRSISEKTNWIKYANERLILELCDVLDNFERAVEQQENDEPKAFRKGIEMIYKQLSELLKKENVIKIDALHKEFNPLFHEALARIPSDKEENLVVAIIQNGYLMNDKLIRPARVAVSNGEELSKEDKKKGKK